MIHEEFRLCGPQGQPCKRNCGIDCHWETAEVETPHDKAARHFWEPNQALHIEAYAGPSRLHRVLDWVGSQWDAAKTGFYDAISLGLYLWRIVTKTALLGIVALLLVFACALVAPLVIPGVMR